MNKNRPVLQVWFDVIMRFFKMFCVYISNIYLRQSGWNLRDLLKYVTLPKQINNTWGDLGHSCVFFENQQQQPKWNVTSSTDSKIRMGILWTTISQYNTDIYPSKIACLHQNIYPVRYGCRIMGWLGTMGWQMCIATTGKCVPSHPTSKMYLFKIHGLWLYRKSLCLTLFLFLT